MDRPANNANTCARSSSASRPPSDASWVQRHDGQVSTRPSPAAIGPPRHQFPPQSDRHRPSHHGSHVETQTPPHKPGKRSAPIPPPGTALQCTGKLWIKTTQLENGSHPRARLFELCSRFSDISLRITLQRTVSVQLSHLRQSRLLDYLPALDNRTNHEACIVVSSKLSCRDKQMSQDLAKIRPGQLPFSI